MIQKAGFECISGNEVINMLIKKGDSHKKIINDYYKTSLFFVRIWQNQG